MYVLIPLRMVLNLRVLDLYLFWVLRVKKNIDDGLLLKCFDYFGFRLNPRYTVIHKYFVLVLCTGKIQVAGKSVNMVTDYCHIIQSVSVTHY